MEKQGHEVQELKHDAVPGGKAAFYIITSIAALYLAIVLLNSL
jgi:hypothetical protein